MEVGEWGDGRFEVTYDGVPGVHVGIVYHGRMPDGGAY